MEPFDLRNWLQFTTAGGTSDQPHIVDQIAIDSRRISSKQALFVALGGTNCDGHSFLKQAAAAGARYAIVRHNSSTPYNAVDNMQLLRVEDPLRALQQIAAAYRKLRPATCVAITGSYGKTMFKDLLYHLLATEISTFASPESFNSQLGVALSLLKIKDYHQIALIEAGISQPNEMQYHAEMICPDHTIITTIGTAHISSLGTKETILKEKLILVNSTKSTNWSILPQIDPSFLPETKYYIWEDNSDENNRHTLPQVIKYPTKTTSTESYGHCYKIIFPNGLSYEGKVVEGLSYVIDLITIAVKTAYLLGITEQAIIKNLSCYIPEPMRIELWKSEQDATIINDTYCADPMSCDLTLKQFAAFGESADTFCGKKIFLFGGLRHGADSSQMDMQRLAHAVNRHRVDLMIILNEPQEEEFLDTLRLIAPTTKVLVAEDQKKAFSIAKAHLKPHDMLIIKGQKKHAVNDVIREFDESVPNNQIIINLAAIQSNIEALRNKVGTTTRIMVMVKALAYGTDDVRIAQFLKTLGIDILGVSYVDEGVHLRKLGVTQDIFVLNITEYEAAKAIRWNLEIGVSEPRLVQSIQKEALLQNKQIKVHLHVDTGMNRFGCKLIDVLPLATMITKSSHLVFEGIMTHFACSDDPEEDAFTLNQAAILQQAIGILAEVGIHPHWKHAANSSAAIRFHFPSFNMVRIGLAVYGLYTSPSMRSMVDLRPAISLISKIVGINHCSKGDTVSYGRQHRITKEAAQIAVLPIGYFDGLHRHYSGKGYVMIHGKKAPMTGNICMDYMMCDISDIPFASIGDPVLIFGEDENGQYIGPEGLASSGGSIVHELMTCLGPRIRRLFIYDESLRPR